MKRGMLAACVLALALALGGGPALAKDELVIAGGDNAVAGKFDPTTGYGAWEPDVYHCHLVKVGKGNELVLDLAESEKISEDGLTYTYTIRKDAKFADGHPLTAEDVVFTFETAKSKPSASDLTAMETVKALDDHTVEFTLNKPSSIFGHILTYVGIVPKHAYKEGYGDRPLGSGAWRIVDFQIGQQLILEPNPHYYGPKSPFKRVTILHFDEDAILAACRSGQIDFARLPLEVAFSEVKGMKKLTLDVIGTMGINLPVIPEQDGPDGAKVGNNVTCDPAIREALNIGIDRKTIVEQALNGYGKPIYSIGGDVLPWSGRVSFQDGRVEEAKKLLDEAGWKVGSDGVRVKNGQRAEFTITGRSNDSGRYNTVVALAENVKPLGIRINAKSMAWAEARKARAVPTCWSTGMSCPADFYQFFHSSQINVGTIGNPPSYANPEVDRLIDQALAARSQDEANGFWQQADRLAAKDYPFLYIATPRDTFLVREGLVIPELGKVPVRQQGGAGLENMNEWSWAD